jgi:hypothetical protein
MWAVQQSDVELFDEARRREMLRDIFALRKWWTLRGGGSFHTLGCALYQDGPRREAFAERVAASNALLREYFSAALADVRAFIGREVDAEVHWRNDLPLPGFHIFGPDAIAVGESRIAPHFDMQFGFAGYDADVVPQVLSVTVPLQLPSGGASLDYWPVDFAEFRDLCRGGQGATVEDAVQLFWAQRMWYVEGRPCVQRGLPLHRIGPSRTVNAGDYRITLQCHAVKDGERWIVYW